jgi:hypothetical protein
MQYKDIIIIIIILLILIKCMSLEEFDTYDYAELTDPRPFGEGSSEYDPSGGNPFIQFNHKLKSGSSNYTKGPNVDCFGLSTPIDMSCGNLKVNGSMCLPDPNDCYFENKVNKCYCKILN